MFKRFDKIVVWHKKKEPYSRYIKGILKDNGESGFVFIPDKGEYEVWNPSLDTLFIGKNVYE